MRTGPIETVLGALDGRAVPAWDEERHFSGDPARTRDYVVVLDTINFCFWGASGGYWQLAEGLRDAFDAGEELEDPRRLSRLTAAELSRWIGELPLMEERVGALRELGRLGVEELGGDLGRLVKGGAARTAAGLAGSLASFRDVSMYEGMNVPLLKRAQILAGDLAGCGFAEFPDLDALTCFADYKLPQALRHLGALEYSTALARRVDSLEELSPGETGEVEIRAATVVIVDRVVEAMAAAGRLLRAFEVDWMLWELSQELEGMRPHHRVRTIFY